MKILITGGNGYIASSIYKLICAKYDVMSISRNDFDLIIIYYNIKHIMIN